MNNQPKPAYRLTHVTDADSYSQQRGTHRVKQTHYVLADGTKSYVELPVDEHTAENVQAKVEEAAANHFDIMSLQGPPTVPGMPTNANPFSSG